MYFIKHGIMKSFFKSYIIVSLALTMLSLGLELNLKTNGLDGALLYLNMMKNYIALDLVVDFVLMMVVALPFFILVQKFSNFSWVHGCVMWFLVLFCGRFTVEFSFTDLTYNLIKNMWLAAAIISFIFTAVYNFFKNREQRHQAKLDEVFE
ncbi:hypothetical protein [Bartonella sp. HY038]|uniref:hypothetical protein n=1 Tax=Bartonella sp. HY038 TaxID=2759660 RepID=UPI0015F8AEE4|nr:hypothetical protein [Bartonella sp. HY038]